jgi:putative lipoprotein
MHLARTAALITLLPLFSACSLLGLGSSSSELPATAGLTRMQGELLGENGQLLFQPCGGHRRYAVSDVGKTGVLQEAATLAAKPGALFVDLRGSFDASKTGGMDGTLKLQQLYRIERNNGACSDPNFKLQTVHASGHSPEWELKVRGNGMVLTRPNQEPLALPYLEEQLPNGRLNLSSAANDQHIDVWLAPQRCVDGASVQFLSAEIRVDGQVQRGCAYFGGARND